MARLYQRDIKIVAGSLTIEPRTAAGENQPMLAVDFKIEKADSKDPNKASLTIWNLAETTRTKLQEKGLEVTIEAGYVDQISQIWKGDIDRVTIGRDAVNWITTLEMTDGGSRLKSSRINQSFRGGQSVGQMLKKAVGELGLDLGNLEEKVRSEGGRSVLKELLSGVVLSGKTEEVIDELAGSMGLKFSVQDKSCMFLGKGEALAGPPVKLNYEKGLLGSPSIGEKQTVKAKSLLNGLIIPGRLIELDSLIVSGNFITRKVTHTGQTWGSDWSSEIEMVAQ